ncbi:hypothetical protein [Polaribacter dokdonensis]|uniref:Lipoprotein n=1 Tax=Polaribacter dokdonensis DSW-5 TaxID=1300348 RepID=A0A0N0CEW7_9FLAO|nr:hypothetical protein [Polaribacter dokdonensis]KOY51030.1 hypothetical protein I602_590 [Polaribacter dokdonensis DSW-5]SEE20305.1 hypothetical protein SAMN05444353_1193 [Polaribacter dokdonensis DSW-5]
MKKVIMTIMTAAVLVSCDVDQTKETKLPEVDVEIETEAGQLPAFDVDWAEVNVGTTTKTVTVPKVVVVMEEVEVEVPYVDVDMPDDINGEKEEQTLMVEAEVSDKEHAIKIKEIRAMNNNLIVISELTEMTSSLGDKKIRISDQVTLNAPDMNVKYYVVGERPDRVFNTKYKYYSDMNTLNEKLGKDYKVIYKK